METAVLIKCLCYATYGYVMYAYDVLADKLADHDEPPGGDNPIVG